jgi:hypothetical protein
VRLDRGPLVCKTFANDRAELVLPEGRAEQLDHRHPHVRQVKIAIGAAVLVPTAVSRPQGLQNVS